MKGHQIQTPKKDNKLNKKPRKVIVKKCLDNAFASPSDDDVALELPEGSIQLSEISEDNQFDQTDESFLAFDALAFCSKESVDLSVLTPSSAGTVTKHVVGNNSAVQRLFFEPDNSSDKDCTVSVEVETLVKNFKEAQTQVKNSTGIDIFYRKLVDKLIDVVVEDFIYPPDKYDRFENLLAMKFKALILSFLLVLLSLVIYLFYGEQSSYTSPLPT